MQNEKTNETAETAAAVSAWNLDTTHSGLSFSVKHMLIAETTGNFGSIKADVKSDKHDFTDAEIHFVAEAGSINTGNEQRDAHLKSDDFFNAEQYPEIIFKGDKLEHISDNKYKVHGKLSIRNVSRDVTWDVECGGRIIDPYGMDRVAFEIKGEINRFDYNLKWNGLLAAGGAIVSDVVKFKANLQFVKPEQS